MTVWKAWQTLSLFMRYRTYKRVDGLYRRVSKKMKIEQNYYILYVNKDLT